MDDLNITIRDWQQVERKVKEEYERRKGDNFRRDHERIWREVDRMVAMQPMTVAGRKPDDWHSAVELGELARASEIITADALRLIFPNARANFEAHVELPPTLDPNTGQAVQANTRQQEFADGLCRALMVQQHMDFGFKARVGLSVKEALHHGSFVAEIRGEDITLFHDNGGIQTVHAPVWVPHSMWNCYPDPSPSVLGTNMFYTGSMIIKEFMPLHVLKNVAMRGLEGGWMPAQLKKIKRRQNRNKDVDTQDIELIKFYGDLVIDRKDGDDVYLPNSKIILANDTIVFYQANPYPFLPVIFNGYERLDVRDPYYTSPLIKLAPLQKLASVLANKFVDAISLHVEPPLMYDANDPQMISQGGPVIAPARMTGTKYMGKGVAPVPIGDPNAALAGLQSALAHIKEGTASDSIQAGKDGGDQTATEVRQDAARREVRVVDFVDKLEYSIKSYLYMQHAINRREMGLYTFYNPELDSPDFMRLTVQEIQYNAHFDVVGARGVLGEEERNQRMSAVTAFASGNPLFAPLLKPADLLKEMYLDAGVKNPERFLVVPDDQLEQIRQQIDMQYKQVIEQGKQMIFDLQQKLAIQQAVNAVKLQEADIRANTDAAITSYKAQIDGQMARLRTDLKIQESEAKQAAQSGGNAPAQVSISEMGSLLKNMESLLEKERTESEKDDADTAKKIDAMMESLKEVGKAVTKLSKPRRLVRDSKGNAVGVEIAD
jgi:hypothetical protein